MVSEVGYYLQLGNTGILYLSTTGNDTLVSEVGYIYSWGRDIAVRRRIVFTAGVRSGTHLLYTVGDGTLVSEVGYCLQLGSEVGYGLQLVSEVEYYLQLDMVHWC